MKSRYQSKTVRRARLVPYFTPHLPTRRRETQAGDSLRALWLQWNGNCRAQWFLEVCTVFIKVRVRCFKDTVHLCWGSKHISLPTLGLRLCCFKNLKARWILLSKKVSYFTLDSMNVWSWEKAIIIFWSTLKITENSQLYVISKDSPGRRPMWTIFPKFAYYFF